MSAISELGTRRRITATAIVTALVLLGACTKKPGGQVLAVVNSEEITQPEVRAEAEAVGVPAGKDFASYGPTILDRVVERDLLAEYAKRKNLNKGPDYLLRRREVEQALLANLAIHQIVTSVPTPSPADVQSFISKNPALFAKRERLTLDQVRFPTPEDVKQIKALVSLGSLDAVVTKLKNEHIPVVRGTSLVDTGVAEPEIAKQLAALPNGQLFDVTINGTTLISAIINRTPAATPSSTWSTAAATEFQREQAQKALADTMKKLRNSAKIQYATGYQPKPDAK